MTQADNTIDKETILITLDQLGQTMEVMNHVLTKLRRYLHSSEANVQTTKTKKEQKNSTVSESEIEALMHWIIYKVDYLAQAFPYSQRLILFVRQTLRTNHYLVHIHQEQKSRLDYVYII